MADPPLITRPRAVNAVNNHPCLLSDMHPLKGCKGKFKNSEIYAIGWKGFSRKEISRPIINQPNRHTFQFSPHISIGPPYSIELVFSLSFSHIFPNILYITLLLRRHLILVPFFHVQPFVGAEKTAGRGFGQIESRWPNPSSNILFCISSNLRFCISFHQG